MKTAIFDNDPFALVYRAYENLYPEAPKPDCYLIPRIVQDDGDEAYGLTTFFDNGAVQIEVAAELSIMNAVEVFAHELAHAAIGPNEDHGPVWEEAFEYIRRESERVAEEMGLQAWEEEYTLQRGVD